MGLSRAAIRSKVFVISEKPKRLHHRRRNWANKTSFPSNVSLVVRTFLALKGRKGDPYGAYKMEKAMHLLFSAQGGTGVRD
ncbi:hypothetical protein TWF102_009712 [Orbilia oligospora]|uniref:Uncharacterized protein n=1 Tax=Orbilia oligospora TaxID=2813651 RepID=A0A7C8J288_ORBOL|nr:hypothetical protein TWF102_009712 [Orbilia oligospora]KAF3136995.1 hypothetical protein TWF703_005316 [Orbilia oligospora]